MSNSYSVRFSPRTAVTPDLVSAALWTIIAVVWYTMDEVAASTVCLGLASVFGLRWMESMEERIDE